MSPTARDELIERLMETFLEELDEHVRVLNRDLLVLEAEPGGAGRAETIKTLFRAAHSLKGAAHSVDAEPIEHACHRLDDLLGQARDGTVTLRAEQLQQLFLLTDTIERAAAQVRASRALRGASTASPPPPHPAPPPAAPPRPAEAPVVRAKDDGFARVSAAKLDTLLDGSGELMVARRRIAARLDDVAALHAAVTRARRDVRRLARVLPRGSWQREAAPEGPARAAPELPRRTLALLQRTELRLRYLERDSERLSAAVVVDSRLLFQAAVPLEEAIHQVRMLPFADACQGLVRAVRDLARTSGKEVDVIEESGDVELDRSVLERLKDPLLHLVRNAVDHGIEAPDVRRARGKPSRGRITIRAALRVGSVRVDVADDGAGLDLDRIRAQARARGLPAAQDERELAQLIFHPGFSTARTVSGISGRGVGLDVVKSRVVALRGSVDLASVRGQGACFTLTVPLTLTMVRVLLVQVGDRSFAFVGASVRTLLRVGPVRISSAFGRESILTDGAPVPLITLADALGIRAVEAPFAGDARLLVVVAAAGDQAVAFVVDALLAEQDVVVKSLPARLQRVECFAGVSVLPSGLLTLVLDTAALIHAALRRPPASRGTSPSRGAAPSPRRRLLVVDDSITTRALEKSILEGEGYEVIAAVDGEDAWKILQTIGADLVISDVEMPRMDGFALTRAIRAVARFRELPVVLLTGLESEADRARGVACGADAYLLKSAFDQRSLLETIKQLL